MDRTPGLLDRIARWLEERLQGVWALVPPWMR